MRRRTFYWQEAHRPDRRDYEEMLYQQFSAQFENDAAEARKDAAEEQDVEEWNFLHVILWAVLFLSLTISILVLV